MYKLITLALVTCLAACAPQIKEVRVEVQKSCLTEAPPKPFLFEAYDGPRQVKGVDQNGNDIVGVATVVSLDSFIAFGQYMKKATEWMKDAFDRCQVK